MTEAPFSPITADAYQAQLALIEKADVVVLSNIPVGFGNLKNIEAAEVVLERLGKKVVVIETEGIEKRNFTGGEAAKRFFELKNKGAIVVKNNDEVLEVLGKCKDIKPKTRSKSPAVRLFYFFFFSVCMYNLWVIVNMILSLVLGIIVDKPLITAKRLIIFLQMSMMEKGSP